MLGKIEGSRRRGQQRITWLDRGAWHAALLYSVSCQPSLPCRTIIYPFKDQASVLEELSNTSTRHVPDLTDCGLKLTLSKVEFFSQ